MTLCGVAATGWSGVVKLGAASYADEFPGAGEAGNRIMTTTPYLTGPAAERPVPTSDWWTQEVARGFGGNIFNYPLGIAPMSSGLCLIKPIADQALTAERPLVIGVEGVSASATYVSDYSDWTYTARWGEEGAYMEATIGLGMPMVYFTKTAPGAVTVNANMGQMQAIGNILLVTGSFNGGNYALYAPTGSTWEVSGSIATSNLGGKDYWTAMLLPDGDAAAAARHFADYAFAFPADTRAEGRYDATKGTVTTAYTVTVDAKEAGHTTAAIGMLPHHWAYLADGSAAPGDYSYKTVRGELRMLEGNSFTTELSYHGVIPVLPDLTTGVEGYDADKLHGLIDKVIEDNGFQDWTDSYNDGLLLNRLTQVARIARQIGYADGLTRAKETLRKQLERWLTYEDGDTDFMFFYHKEWTAMLGFRAGHGQDSSINDHDFHWGYFIQAAAFLGEEDPAWLEAWGGLVDLLVRDANSPRRDDTMFPYMRCFSPYAGHSFANGMSTQPLGADEESTSEAMNFAAAMILWGDLRGDREMRDAGVWIYATTASAIEEYWFDAYDRNFSVSGYPHRIVGMVMTNWNNYGTYWTAAPAGMHGIQIFPTQASSLYLGENRAMAQRHWESLKSTTGVMSYADDPNIWYDTWIRYVAMFNLPEARRLYDNCPPAMLGTKFGDSEANTYYWLNTLDNLGRLHTQVTADHPLARAFNNPDGDVTYVARNNGASPLMVTFSDGNSLEVAPHSLGYKTVAGAADPYEEEEGGGGDDEDPVVGSCTEVGTEAAEGSFAAPYTVVMRTDGPVVTIKASFAGTYVGFAGPWFQDLTNGFSESQMQGDGGVYTYTKYGCKVGDTIKFRIKIAYAGGLGVTKELAYTVGDDCDGLSELAPVIIGEYDEDVQMFDLYGRPVDNPTPGIYIRRTSSGVEKVLVK